MNHPLRNGERQSPEHFTRSPRSFTCTENASFISGWETLMNKQEDEIGAAAIELLVCILEFIFAMLA
jgi:hypothetical protein